MDSFGRGSEPSDGLVVVRRCGSGVWGAGVGVVWVFMRLCFWL